MKKSEMIDNIACSIVSCMPFVSVTNDKLAWLSQIILHDLEEKGMLPPSNEDEYSIYGDSCNISFGDLIKDHCIWEPED